MKALPLSGAVVAIGTLAGSAALWRAATAVTDSPEGRIRRILRDTIARVKTFYTANRVLATLGSLGAFCGLVCATFSAGMVGLGGGSGSSGKGLRRKPPKLPKMPVLPITSDATLASAASLRVEEGDVFICSYPKSGTTWLQNIVVTLLSKGAHPATGEHISMFAPFYDVDATWDNSSGKIKAGVGPGFKSMGRRVFNTHLRWDMMPRNTAGSTKAKYIYVVRDGKDVVTSFYHHLSNQADSGGYEGSFDDFYDGWLSGTTPYGRWLDHCVSYLGYDGQPPVPEVLVLYYEDMKQDLKGTVKSIANHLDLKLSDAQIEHDILPKVSFQYMKTNQDLYQPQSVGWKPGYEFIRKGQVGDHKKLLSDGQRARFNEQLRATLPDDCSWLKPNYKGDGQ